MEFTNGGKRLFTLVTYRYCPFKDVRPLPQGALNVEPLIAVSTPVLLSHVNAEIVPSRLCVTQTAFAVAVISKGEGPEENGEPATGITAPVLISTQKAATEFDKPRATNKKVPLQDAVAVQEPT
jgi:hypothetical protein